MSSTHRFAVLLPIVLVGLAIPACATATTPTQPGPTATPTTSFHALVVAGTTVDALNPATGTLMWTRSLDSNINQAPSAMGSIIALSTTIPSTQPPEGRVVALAAQTGATVWQQDLGADTQGHIAAVGSDFVLATSAVSIEAPNAPIGVTVSALLPTDGASIWRHTLPDSDLLPPLLSNAGRLFVLTVQFASNDMSYTLTAFDLVSGTQLWQKALGTGTVLGYVAGDGAVYVSMFPGHMPAEDSIQLPVAAAPSASSFDTSLFAQAPDGSPSATLTAYAASDGAQLWQVNGFTTAQAEIAGTVYGTTQGLEASGATTFTVTAYHATSGTRLWQSDPLGTGDVYEDKPTIAVDAHRVYVFNMPEDQPSVHALDSATGHIVWTAPLAAHIAATCTAMDTVFVGTVAMPPDVETMQTSVMALDGATGATNWTHDMAPAANVGLVLQ